MLNKKGQTLIMFVLLLPVLLILIAFIIDTGFMYLETSKLNGTTKTVLKNMYYQKDDTEFEKKFKLLLQKNKIEINNISIKVDNDSIKVKNNYKIDSYFGKLIGIKEYEIKSSLKAFLENDKVKVIKE